MILEATAITPTHRRRQTPEPGLLGAVVGSATMLAAVGVGLTALFGRILIAAAAATLLWPLLFAPDFTQWVFGSPRLPFWKALIIAAILSAVFKYLRRQSWRKK